MKTAFFINQSFMVDLIRPVVPWLNDYLVFTDKEFCRRACEKYGLKNIYIKDYRIMNWEMATYNPSVFVQFDCQPALFPRNGSVNIYIPKQFNIFLSDSLHAYDYILVSNKHNKKLLEDFGIPGGRVKIVGFTKYSLLAEGKEVELIKSEQMVWDKYQGTNYLNLNAGSNIAAFITRVGERNKLPTNWIRMR
ncbi:MAG: hypothetical protein WC476_01490 [Phycisphaerae bacterium]